MNKMLTPSNDQPETNANSTKQSKEKVYTQTKKYEIIAEQYNHSSLKGVTHMNIKTKNDILELVKELAIINRILVRDEKKMTDEDWYFLDQREKATMKTITELLDKEVTL